MALLIEDGTGVLGANSYVTTAEVSSYLTDRDRATEWDAAAPSLTTGSLLEATDYIENKFRERFKGFKEFLDIQGARGLQTYTVLPIAGSIVTIGTTVYTFQDTMVAPFDVQIEVKVGDTIDNLIAAINLNGTDGVEYFAGTTQHPTVTAVRWYDFSMLVEANDAGKDGNFIVCTTDVVGATWSNPTLLSGNDELRPQTLSFPRQELFDYDGKLVQGIPGKLKEATAEYASRALAETLMPDPTQNTSGLVINSLREKVGPLETEVEYAGGSATIKTITQSYPAADRLLSEYLFPAGRIFRG